MRTKLFILTLFALTNAFGQVDSSTYYEFIKYPDVDSIMFVNETYSDKKPKEQGWIVVYRNGANSKIFKVNNSTADQSFVLKVGIWKGFYKSGQLSYTDTIFINEYAAGNVRTSYDKKGRMTLKNYNVNQKEIDKKHTKVFFKQPYEKSSDMSLGDRSTVINYYTNGQIASIWYYCGPKACGTDLYFDKKGKLKKEVKHKN
jgi:hypothetical protein